MGLVSWCIRPLLTPLLVDLAKKNDADSRTRKWLIFVNSRTLVEDFAASMKAFLDSLNLPGDIVTIVGTQRQEQKKFYTKLYV